MKRLTAGSIFLTLFLFCAVSNACESPVTVTQTVTGFTRDGNSATIDYSIHVLNPGAKTFTNISLALVPMPPLRTKAIRITVGDLGPNQTVEVPVRIITYGRFEKEFASGLRLSWAGTCNNSEGAVLEFPVKSRPGGVR